MSQVYLAHHGILGQKWGVRRYQNPDGSLTEAGKNHVKQRYDEYNNKNLVQKGKDTYKGKSRYQTLTIEEGNQTVGYTFDMKYKAAVRKAIIFENKDNIVKKLDDSVIQQGSKFYNKILQKENEQFDAQLKKERKAQYSEINKLMSKKPELKKDFGSADMIDDLDYFEYVARTEYGLNTDDLLKVLYPN